MDSKNIFIPLSKEADEMLEKIITDHSLQESREEMLKKVRADKLFNSNIILKLTRSFLLKKISNVDFLNNLYSELGITKEKIKSLAIDITDNLIPLLKQHTEDELINHRRKNSTSNEEISTQEAVLQKIRGLGSEKEPAPKEPQIGAYSIKYGQTETSQDDKSASKVKKPETESVEENAELMKKARTVIPKTEQPPQQQREEQQLQPQKEPDKYREAIE